PLPGDDPGGGDRDRSEFDGRRHVAYGERLHVARSDDRSIPARLRRARGEAEPAVETGEAAPGPPRRDARRPRRGLVDGIGRNVRNGLGWLAAEARDGLRAARETGGGTRVARRRAGEPHAFERAAGEEGAALGLVDGAA